MAIITSRNEMRNGIRQPHSLKASLPKYVRVPTITARDTTIPSVGDVCSQPV